MLNKTIKFFATVLAVVVLFGTVPLALQAYGAYVTTGNVINITSMNATFNGTVDTGGLPGSAWFEYGTNTAFGSSTSLNAYNFNAGYSGNYNTNVTGLTPNTTYYVRAVAQNSYGRMNGAVTSFTTTNSSTYTYGYNNYNNYGYNGYNNNYVYNNTTTAGYYDSSPTAPTVTTLSGIILSNSTAQFNSLVTTGNNNSATSWFEWGTTVNLGNQTVIMPISGTSSVKHTNTISGLTPGTAYYFRAVAQNSYGTSYGSILSLVTTGSAPSTVVRYYNVNPPTTQPNITNTDTYVPYSTNQNVNGAVSAASVLGANIFGTGSFLPTNLFGWLLILILILAIVFLGRHLFGQTTIINSPTHHD